MKIEQAMQEAEAELRSKPNVIGVGVGSRGERQVIKVLVTRKVPRSELEASEIVPATIRGFPTDVEEVGVVTAQSTG